MDMGCHAFEFFRWLLGKPAGASGQASRAGEVQTQSHETAFGEIVPLVRPQALSVWAEMARSSTARARAATTTR